MSDRELSRGGRTRVSRAEEMSRLLELEIEAQGLRGGARLGTKDDLRKRFGVAAATVNEALQILNVQGLIDARPGRGGGIFVADLSLRGLDGPLVLQLDADADAPPAEWREIFDALAPTVCRKAARRCSSRDARSLRRIVTEMREASGEPERLAGLGWTLRRAIAELGDSPPLTRLYHQLLDILELADAAAPAAEPAMVVEAHEALVEAIVAGSARELEAALGRHRPS